MYFKRNKSHQLLLLLLLLRLGLLLGLLLLLLRLHVRLRLVREQRLYGLRLLLRHHVRERRRARGRHTHRGARKSTAHVRHRSGARYTKRLICAFHIGLLRRCAQLLRDAYRALHSAAAAHTYADAGHAACASAATHPAGHAARHSTRHSGGHVGSLSSRRGCWFRTLV